MEWGKWMLVGGNGGVSGAGPPEAPRAPPGGTGTAMLGSAARTGGGAWACKGCGCAGAAFAITGG